jgi:hemoglobin-like flavoprotein
MMMAHDMSPTPPTLDEATISAVRASLSEFARHGDSPTQLRDALRQFAADARSKGISAEHLLIVLKNLLSSLPEMRNLTEQSARDALKQRIITVCIEQYYQK